MLAALPAPQAASNPAALAPRAPMPSNCSQRRRLMPPPPFPDPAITRLLSVPSPFDGRPHNERIHRQFDERSPKSTAENANEAWRAQLAHGNVQSEAIILMNRER
jgi:hypothetical protein